MRNDLEILFFAPIWGNILTEDEFISRVKSAGYDGIEMALPDQMQERDNWLQKLSDSGLKLIAQQWQTAAYAEFQIHKQEMIRVLELACQAKPLKINTQTGKDFFSFQQNAELIAIAEDISAKYAVQIVHEIHRSRFNAHPVLLMPYLRRYPELKLTADFSHWCCVCESLLEDQQEMLSEVMPHIRHIHARVGFSQGAQVNDFQAPEHSLALSRHLLWWNEIIQLQAQKNIAPITITPEFGPAPYMPSIPYTNMPIAEQWQQNFDMMQLLKKRAGIIK